MAFSKRHVVSLLFGACAACGVCGGQGLSPRAYVITPIHWNAVTLTYEFQDGNIVFNDTVPIADARGSVNSETVTLFHALNFLGRSANLNISLPYSFGNFSGTVSGKRESIYRSGLAPAQFRLSINLKGGPAMTPADFSKWRQKTVIGASITVVTPSGQYDPTRLVNIGANRWAIKPEIGFSRRRGNWLLDAYAGVWFFTANTDFFSSAPGSKGPNSQTQKPMGVVEMHLSYDVKPRFWFSIDGNYWYGGTTSLNGIVTPTTVQSNSRIGGTLSVPVTGRQSIKFSYSTGTYVSFGGDYQTIQAAWQYSWIGRPN